MKIYLAASLSEEHRQDMYEALKILREIQDLEVYAPVEHKIPMDWDYPNNEWGLMVFSQDLGAIQNSDLIVALSYGRENSGGIAWEMGYSYGIGKKVLLVEMTDHRQSLMMANGRYASVKGLNGLKDYDFKNLPKTRTETEQK